jgi:hypothetical protein
MFVMTGGMGTPKHSWYVSMDGLGIDSTLHLAKMLTGINEIASVKKMYFMEDCM